MFNFDPNDPRQVGLLMAAAQMLSPGPGGTAGALSRAVPTGLMGYQTIRGTNDRRSEEEQQREIRKMQMEQMRASQEQAAQRNQALQGLAAQNPQLAPLFQLAPDKAIDRAFPQPKMGFAPDGRAVDMNAIKPGESYAKPPDWMDPKYVQVQSQIRAAGRPVTNVNTNLPPLEKKEQQEQGALNVKNFGELQTVANVARRENALLTGLEKIPLETGALTPANVTLSSWVAALGGGQKFKDVASQGQGFTAFAKDLVLQRQLAQKGPQTESDARRLEQTVASLGNTKDANSLLISFNKAINDRTIAQEKFYRDWWSKKKTYEGAEEAWFAGDGSKSVWDDPKLKKYQSSSGTVLRFDKNGNPI